MRSAVIAGLLVCLLAGTVVGTPILTVRNPEYDFGSIGIGYMVKHTFILENTGDATLQIFRVRASCGCTTTELETDTLAPGQSIPLEVLVLADHGSIKNVSIYVYSNAPDTSGNPNDDQRDPDITMKVRGDLTAKPDYETAPFELAYDFLVLVDVRDPSAFQTNHLIGAINMPAGSIMSDIQSLPRDAWIVLYDASGEQGSTIAQNLISAGYAHTYYLVGGLAKWVEVQGNDRLLYASPLPASSGSTVVVSGQNFDSGTLKGNLLVLVDTRSAGEFAAGHLAGAINLSLAQVSSLAGRIPAGAKIIVYDGNGTSTAAAAAAFERVGFTNVTGLLGGLNEWIYQYGDRYVLQN